MTFGTVGTVIGMAKDALDPVMGTASQMGQAVGGTVSGAANTGWDCPECGYIKEKADENTKRS